MVEVSRHALKDCRSVQDFLRNQLKQPMIDLLNSRCIPYKEEFGEVAGYDRIVSDVLYELYQEARNYEL